VEDILTSCLRQLRRLAQRPVVMPITPALVTLFALASGALLPERIHSPSILKRQHGHQDILKFPDWHYVNATTPGAKPDGSFGVILEPDLVPGKPGKDGATVTKGRVGPFHVRPGRSQEYPILPFQPPCVDCWITAMQLGLEYADGKEANTDTGAWYVVAYISAPVDVQGATTLIW
jgi:hypothetical protein